MKIDLFTIGSLTIHGYGLMIGIGLLVAILVAEKRAKNKGMNQEPVIDLAIICGLLGFAGGKLFFVLTNLETFRKEPLQVLGSSGFVVYGGIIVSVISVLVYCHIKKVEFMPYFDLIVPEVAIAQGFGRIGCFLAGCCYGRETDCALGVVFPAGGMAPAGVRLIPTQLMSSAGDFLIAAALILIDRKLSKREHPIAGTIGFLYMIFYGVGRFLIEFLRNDERGSVGPFSTSQFIAIFVVAIAAGFMIWNQKRNRAGQN